MSKPEGRRHGRRIPYTKLLTLIEAFVWDVQKLVGDDEDEIQGILLLASVSLDNYAEERLKPNFPK